jgi:hypothetical protein
VLVPFGVGRDTALAYSLVAQAMTYTVMLLLGLPSVYEVFASGTGIRACVGSNHT